MQVTQMELIFLNSITPGNHIWGLPLKVPRTEKRKELYQETIAGLVRKRLLKAENQLSILGAATAKQVDDYKRAQKHVLLNRLHIAMLPGLGCVTIVPVGQGYIEAAYPSPDWSDNVGAARDMRKNDEYEILRQNRAAILLQILRSYEELCAGGRELDLDSLCSVDHFVEELPDYPGRMLLGKYEGGRSIEEGVLYWDRQKIYYYDVKEGRKRRLSAPQARNFLVDILELREGGKTNG